jgi:nickel-dependent lactate racemase
MSFINIPYGRGNILFDVSKHNKVHILLSKEYRNSLSEKEIVIEALRNPICSKPLCELSKDIKTVLLITNDMTRPMPSKITIPAIIEEIKKYNKDVIITILVASGLHREMNREELIDKMGQSIVDKYKVLVHNAYDKKSLAYFGDLSTGNPLWLNKEVLNNDLVIAEGFIEAHWLAGFSGGRKSIFPGIAGADTVMNNHSPKNVDDPRTKPGNLVQNPAHEEFVEAASKAKLSFIMNIVLDKDKRVIKAFAGDPFIAHETGCEFVRGLMEVECDAADITITTNNGYPLDLNLYQSCKGMDTASFATKENGIIIMCTECAEGVGHKGFAEVFKKSRCPKFLLDEMRNGNIKIYDQWGAQVILNIMVNYKIILVTSIDKETIESMNMIYASSLDDAMSIAKTFFKEEPLINVIPEGPIIIPKIKEN